MPSVDSFELLSSEGNRTPRNLSGNYARLVTYDGRRRRDVHVPLELGDEWRSGQGITSALTGAEAPAASDRLQYATTGTDETHYPQTLTTKEWLSGPVRAVGMNIVKAVGGAVAAFAQRTAESAGQAQAITTAGLDPAVLEQISAPQQAPQR